MSHSNLSLQGKTALVTGGSRGIGRAICVQLARKGAKVLVNYAGNEAAAVETVKLVRDASFGLLHPADLVSAAVLIAFALVMWRLAVSQLGRRLID